MAIEFSIDRDTGSIRIGDIALLGPDARQATVQQQVDDLIVGSRDYGNGYEWLERGALTFGGRPAYLSLCFQNDALEQASWSVQLPDAATEGGWPTREAIDAEIAFVRRTLATEMGICAGHLPWGEVWSNFDTKGFMAANGLRYRHS